MPFVDLDKVKISYQERGSGIPLLILPGFGLDSSATIATLEPILRHRKGWWRIYPDMPGTGKTPVVSSVKTADDWLSCLSSLVNHVIGDNQFALAGISYGAYMARGILLRFVKQVLGIYLGIPCIIPDQQHRTLPKLQVFDTDPSFLASKPLEERKSFEEIAVIQTQAMWERFEKIILKSMKNTNWNYLNQFQKQNYAFSFDLDEKLPPFSGPSLIITGRQDSMCGYRDAMAIIEKFPRATFVVLDRAGHCLEFEQEALYRRLISEWLDRVFFTIQPINTTINAS